MLRFPAEWEPQSAIMLTWPHASTDWQPILSDVETVYIEICKAIAPSQPLLIVCHNAALQQKIMTDLQLHGVDLQRIRFAIAPCDDTWARDHGPITVFEGETPKLLDFQFNGWGGKYGASDDNLITQRLFQQAIFAPEVQHNTVDFILEGGSIESDGQGTLLTTAHCLLTDTRNNQLTQTEIEQFLRQQFNLQHVIWLNTGELLGDDTDAHIDTLARLCPNNTICYVRCNDATDPQYAGLQAMEKELQHATNAKGESYRLIPLPWPAAHYDNDGQRLPATYANFLICNELVLVPTYRDANNDPLALKQIARCFPQRQIIGIDCVPLIHQHGSLHCITMQLPTGVISVE